MKISKEQYEKLKNKIDNLELALNGGKGSGNFGHAGRKGERGGSLPKGEGSNGASHEHSLSDKEEKEIVRHGETWTPSLSDKELEQEISKEQGKLARLRTEDKRKKSVKQDILWSKALIALYEATLKSRKERRAELMAEKED